MRVTITDITADRIAVSARYNVLMTERARELEGKWQEKWIFDKSKEGAVRAALDEIYLLPTKQYISIKVTAKSTLSSELSMVCFHGFPVAKKVVGIKVPITCPGVKKLGGKMYFSGSKVMVEKGCAFVLHDMSSKWLEVGAPRPTGPY